MGQFNWTPPEKDEVVSTKKPTTWTPPAKDEVVNPQKKSPDGTSNGYQPTQQDIQQKNSLNAVQVGSEKLQGGSNPSQSHDILGFRQVTPGALAPTTSGSGRKKATEIPLSDKQKKEQDAQLKEINDANAKVKSFYDQLDPQERNTLYNINNTAQKLQQKSALRPVSKDQQEEQHMMDSTLGKVVGSLGYLETQANKGGVDILKGSAWLINHLNSGFSDTQTIPDSAFKTLDEKSNMITPGQQSQIESSKGMGWGAVKTLGMFANLAPTIAAGEIADAPKIAFTIQGIGQGKQTMDDVDPEHKINPIIRDTFVLGTGILNGTILGDEKLGMFGKASDEVKDKVVQGIVANALKETAEKNLTQEGFAKVLNKSKDVFADKMAKLIPEYAEHTSKAAIDFAALKAGGDLLKGGVDLSSDKPVFNQTIGKTMEDISDIVIKQAPLFGALGLLHGTDIEKQKYDLGKQIAEKDEQIKTFSEKSDDPVKNVENEVNLEQAKKDREDLNNQLKTIILKQKGNEQSKRDETSGGQPTEKSEQVKTTETPVGNGEPSVQEVRNDDEGRKSVITPEVKTGDEKSPNLQVGDEVQWTNQGVDQFDKPRKITGISDDGKYAFVEGSNTDIPIEELNKPKGEQENAVQEQSTGKVDVQPTPENGEKVGEGNTEPKVTPKKGEEKPQEKSVTSIKNAKIDADREKRGLSPIMSETKKDFASVWDGAMSKIDDDPQAGVDLVNELQKSPRATTDVENALIAHTLADTKNKYDKINDQIVKAQDEGEDTKPLEAKLDAISDDLQKIEEVAKKTGTETARGLNSRKMMINDDMTLASLETKKRVAVGRKLTPEERDNLRKVADEYKAKTEAYEKKIAELEQRNKELQEKSALEKLKKETKKAAKAKTRSERKAERSAIVEDIRNKLKASRQSLSAKIPVLQELIDIAPELTKLAKSYIAEGIDKLDDLVDKIHDDIKDIFDDLEKRQVRDAISGYGRTAKLSQEETAVKLRELKAQARAISALEDTKEGERPLKTGLQRDKVSDKVRELQAKVREEMKKLGINVKTQEEHLKTSLDAVKTRLKNQIKDLTRQIETGEKPPEKSQIQYDDEAKSLKAKRDALKEQLGDLDKSGMSDEQKIKNALAATQRSIDEYNRRIKEKDFESKKRGMTLSSPELEKLREERDKAREEYEDLKNAANPKLTPEQRALKTIKTRTANQIAEFQRRIKEKDFEPTPKKQAVELDPEAVKAKAELNRVKGDFDAELEKDRLAKRGKWEKGLDNALKYRRAELLLNLSGAAKVGMASAYRILSQPLHEIAGSGLKVIPGLKQIAEKAPREGHGFVSDVEWKALKTVWNAETLAEVKKKFKGKLDNLDVAFGDKKEHFDTNALLDLAGNIHSAEKEFAKQNEFRRSVLLRTKWAEQNGLDIENPFVQLKIGEKALEDANRQIFMADNLANTSYKFLISYLEKSKKFPKAGTNAALALKVMLPIVKVPTNYLLEKVQYTPVLGAIKAFNIMARGLDNMKPEEADYVMRVMKKQSLGAGLMLIGYFNPQAFGGLYVPGQKRKEGDLAANDLKLFGINVPHFLTHTPLLTIMQLGATMRRASFGETSLGTAADFAESTPFYETPKEIVRGMENSKNASQYIGNFIRGLIIPNVVSQSARYFDTDEEGNTAKRKPRNVWQGIEEGIPGLRQNIPEKTEEPNFDKIEIKGEKYQLNDKQVEQRQKYYDDYMQTESAKEMEEKIKDAKPIEKKKLLRELHEKASKHSLKKLREDYYDPENNSWKFDKIEEDEN